MKVEKVNLEEKKVFQPVSINITLETEKELAAFYAIFNYNPITSAEGIDGIIDHELIREILNDDLEERIDWEKFTKSVKKRV